MIRSRALSVSFLLFLVLACLPACVVGTGPDVLQHLQLPTPGTTASPAWFAELEPYAGRVGERTTFWALPMWMSVTAAHVDDEGAPVIGGDMTVFNLGLVGFPWLPLYVSASETIVRDGDETSEAHASWSPLWASSGRTAWHGDDPWVSMRGMPLFYGRIDYGRPAEEPMGRFHNVLWSLGPAWGWFDLEDHPYDAEGWFFTPLMAAGLGPLLWTSFDVDSDEVDVAVHGPLVGLLGYMSVVDHEDRDRMRMVIGGALWMDYSDVDGAGQVRDSMHGPLWGMFGWGRSNGRPAIRLLWIPIRF